MPCIYGIIDSVKRNGLIDVYIGSSIDFNKRMPQHKSKSNKCSSKQIIERNNYTMKILEESERWNKLTTKIKEQQYKDKYGFGGGAGWEKYNVVNINNIIKIPRPPPTREEIESTRQARENYRRFAIFKGWLLSWNEYNIPLYKWGEEPLSDDNMLWIDYDLFIT